MLQAGAASSAAPDTPEHSNRMYCGCDGGEAGRAVDAFTEVVADLLQRGDSISFPGFGKFSTSQRAERTGIHPQTREPMTIAAARVPRFTAGSGLKKAVK